MHFPKTPRGILVVFLIVLAVALSYRFGPALVSSLGGEKQALYQPDLPIAREVSAVAAFEVPDGTDKVRFILGLDENGAVVATRTTDVLAGDSIDEHLQEFSDNLLIMLKGRKLSELTAVDKVGKSSLTTKAFNSAIPDLQKQL